MGSKKRRLMLYTGSLIRPPFRYLLKMDLLYTSRDRRGTAMAENFVKQLITSPSRNFQPNFEYSYICDNSKEWTTMYLKFITGWEHTYYLGKTSPKCFMEHLEKYNYIIEGIRNAQGMDDELEDEVSHIQAYLFFFSLPGNAI